MRAWNAFSQVATSAFVALGASFTPGFIQVVSSGTSSQYGQFLYRIFVPSGVLPAWVQPGAAVKIAASVTIAARSYDFSDTYTVRNVDSGGTYFDVNPHSGGDAVAFSQLIAKTAVDSGAGAQPTPLVNLDVKCQKAMLQCTAGTVIVAPVIDHSGNAPYSITLTPLATGGQEYDKTVFDPDKFDLADWYVKYSGSGTLTVCFL